MDKTTPNIRHLQAVREVARTHSVSAAAAGVHLSQPAISQAIAGLEERLGVSLFERRADGMFATDLGAMFLDRVDRALDLLRAGAREASRLGPRRGGTGFRDFDRLLTAAQLRALTAMSGAGSFSMAARDIGISQPSLHRAARDLERLSGLSLFARSSRGIELTPAAEALAQHAKLAAAELGQGFDELAEHLGRDSTHVVVGTLPLARTYILPTAINALIARNKRVQVRVIDGPYAELLHGLRHGEIDFLIGALRNPSPADDVEQERLFDDPLAIVARRGHPLAGRRAVTISDVMAFPWVAPPKTTPAGSYLFDILQRLKLPATPVRVVSSSLVLVRGVLLTSDCVTIISLHQVRHELEEGLLVPLPIELPDSQRPIGLTFRRDWRPTATQQELLRQVRIACQSASGNGRPAIRQSNSRSRHSMARPGG